MPKYQQGIYTPTNPAKYVGKHDPKYRSGWELVFMRMCDNHSGIIKWASEATKIPYRNPFTGRIKHYIPDFFIVYQDKNGKSHAEIVEIKPKAQSKYMDGQRRSDRSAFVLNIAKWQSADEWCKRQGMKFRVVTEADIFKNVKGK